MQELRRMFLSHPKPSNINQDLTLRCLTECMSCAQICTMCADACLSEAQVSELTECIRTNLDCADVCEASARILGRQTGFEIDGVLRSQLGALFAAVQKCAAECEEHAGHHEHCRICAENCRRCEALCHELLGGKQVFAA